MKVVKEYEAKLDTKNRCVIHRVTPFERYHVKVYDNGTIEMTPRILASPEDLSKKTLRMIYSAAKNLKKGKSGTEVDFEQFKEYIDSKEE